MCDYWLNHRASQKRSGHHDRSIITQLRHAFGRMLLQNVGVAAVDKYGIEHAHLDPETLASHFTVHISMMNLAVDLGWLLKAPKIQKPKVRLFSPDYRYLRTEEITRFLQAAHDEGELAASQWQVGFPGMLTCVSWTSFRQKY